MATGRCQICARRVRLNVRGEIAGHYHRGERCAGANYAPIEREDSQLLECARLQRAIASRLAAEIADLMDRRVNRIEPELLERYGRACATASRLERRLARHRAWPERFRRDMERHGYGYPPPAYLVERERLAA